MDFRNVAGTRNPEDSVTRKWLPAGQRCHCCRLSRERQNHIGLDTRETDDPFCRVPEAVEPFSGCQRTGGPFQGAREQVGPFQGAREHVSPFQGVREQCHQRNKCTGALSEKKTENQWQCLRGEQIHSALSLPKHIREQCRRKECHGTGLSAVMLPTVRCCQ